jgi:hypothetical protein
MAGAAGFEPATYGFGVPRSSLKILAYFSNRSSFGSNMINGLQAEFQLKTAPTLARAHSLFEKQGHSARQYMK